MKKVTVKKKLIVAGQEHPFSSKKVGRIPTTKEYSQRTKVKSPESRGM